jgi:hypothetical protein
VAELLDLQIDYQAWLDALPENLAVSATADALREICGLDLSELTSVEPPRGFGRSTAASPFHWRVGSHIDPFEASLVFARAAARMARCHRKRALPRSSFSTRGLGVLEQPGSGLRGA